MWKIGQLSNHNTTSEMEDADDSEEEDYPTLQPVYDNVDDNVDESTFYGNMEWIHFLYQEE